MAIDVSILTQVFGQPKMLAEFVQALRGWPQSASRRVELIVVDDCGKPAVEASELDGLLPMEVQAYRVLDQIPWNQPGCRNLATKVARGQSLILVDPDMIIEPSSAEAFVNEARNLKPRHVTKFAMNWKGNVVTDSPNTWIIRKDDLVRVNGYNEDFSGHKGWSDVELMHVLDSAYRISKNTRLQVKFVKRDTIPDADVRSLQREVSTNHAKHNRHRADVKMKFAGNWSKWAIANAARQIRFRYKRII